MKDQKKAEAIRQARIKIERVKLSGWAGEEKLKLLNHLERLAEVCPYFEDGYETAVFSPAGDGGFLNYCPPELDDYVDQALAKLEQISKEDLWMRPLPIDAETELAAELLFSSLLALRDLASAAQLSALYPQYLTALAQLTRAMVQVLNEISVKFPQAAQEAAAHSPSWPFLLGARKLKSDDANFELHESLKIGSQKPLLQQEIIRRRQNRRAAPGKTVMFELLWRLNVFRTTNGWPTRPELAAEREAVELPPFKTETLSIWMKCAANLLNELTNGHAENAPVLSQLFKTGGAHSTTPGTKAANIRKRIMEELKRSFHDAANDFYVTDSPCSWDPSAALWHPFQMGIMCFSAPSPIRFRGTPSLSHHPSFASLPDTRADRYNFLFSVTGAPNQQEQLIERHPPGSVIQARERKRGVKSAAAAKGPRSRNSTTPGG